MRKFARMVRTQFHLRHDELDALREVAERSGCGAAELMRNAIRKVVLKPNPSGPVALWDGEIRRSSIEHDRIHDEV
jgi:hypothetical protein